MCFALLTRINHEAFNSRPGFIMLYRGQDVYMHVHNYVLYDRKKDKNMLSLAG